MTKSKWPKLRSVSRRETNRSFILQDIYPILARKRSSWKVKLAIPKQWLLNSERLHGMGTYYLPSIAKCSRNVSQKLELLSAFRNHCEESVDQNFVRLIPETRSRQSQTIITAIIATQICSFSYEMGIKLIKFSKISFLNEHSISKRNCCSLKNLKPNTFSFSEKCLVLLNTL